MSAVRFITYGVKYPRRSAPKADLHVNCQTLPNPWSHMHLTGKDKKVQSWLTRQIKHSKYLKRFYRAVRKRIGEGIERAAKETCDYKVAFYCMGGRHRSVFTSETIAKELRERGIKVTIRHLELNRTYRERIRA